MKPLAVILLAFVFAFALSPAPNEAQAEPCYHAVQVYPWEYYYAGYYGRTWYAAGWYRWNGYGYDYRVHYRQALAYTVSYDPDKARLFDIVDRLLKVAEKTTGQPIEDRPLAVRAEFRDAHSVLTGRCASCHGEAAAAEKGKDFVIDPESVSRNDARLMLGRVNSADPAKRMPPTGALPSAEKKLLDGLLKKPRQPEAQPMAPAD